MEIESFQPLQPLNSGEVFIQSIERELSQEEKGLHVVELKESIDENTFIELNHDLKAAKDQFSKLKFNFLELETKEKFLQAILQSPNSLPPLESSDLEQQVDAAKAKVKASKQQNRALLDSITQQIATVVKRIERNDQLKAIATKKIAELRDLEKEIEEVNAIILDSADVPPISLESSKSILEKQKLFIEELVAQQEERRARVNTVVQEIQREEKEITELRATLVKLQAQARRVEELEKGRDLALEEEKSSLVHMIEMVSKQAGFRVERTSNSFEFNVIYTLSGRGCVEEVVCTVVADPSSDKFVGVQIENSAIPIQDVVDHGRETNDLAFVVMELQFRLMSFFKRTKEFEDLEERGYTIEANEDKSLVKVTLLEGPVVSFSLDFDYPRLASNFMLTQITRHRHFDSQTPHQRKIEVLKVQCLLEETRACTTVTEAVLYLQSYLPKLN